MSHRLAAGRKDAAFSFSCLDLPKVAMAALGYGTPSSADHEAYPWICYPAAGLWSWLVLGL